MTEPNNAGGKPVGPSATSERDGPRFSQLDHAEEKELLARALAEHREMSERIAYIRVESELSAIKSLSAQQTRRAQLDAVATILAVITILLVASALAVALFIRPDGIGTTNTFAAILSMFAGILGASLPLASILRQSKRQKRASTEMELAHMEATLRRLQAEFEEMPHEYGVTDHDLGNAQGSSESAPWNTYGARQARDPHES